jgi:hypothetical protein
MTATWSEFGSEKAERVWLRSSTWPGLIERLRTAGGFPTKAACPWIKLAVFGDRRSAKGSLRHDANVVQITGVEGDYDGEVIQPDEAVLRLERAGIKACVYTSPRHRPEAPRWRVLAPLSRPMSPDARAALLARVNGALGGILASESFTLSQSYYFGAVADALDYRVLATFDDPDEGRCVDELDELDDIAVGKSPKVKPNGHDHDAPRPGEHVFAEAVERLGRRLKTGDGRRELLKTFIASRSARGLRGDDLQLLVDGVAARYFDSADPFGADDVAGLIAWANGKDGDEREAQRRRAQAIGDGTADAPPLAELMTLDEMRERLVFVSDGSRVARRDRPQIALPVPEFRLHTKASETRQGKRLVPTADVWLAHPERITTHTITFRPGHPEFTTDPEGAPALNLWQRRERPATKASVQPFLDHVAYLVPEATERERFLDWLAHIEQFPGVLPHTHYLMVTPQTGIGRNWLASVLARVWAGATRLGFDLVGAMNSGFNGPLSRRLLVIVDELKAADTGYGAVNHAQQLKAMLTTEQRNINPKFGRQHIEFNCARWLMLSQHFDALPLEQADRRVVVITNPTERRPVDYYRYLYTLLDKGGFVDAVGAWLAQRDIRGFNPSEPAPLTEAKKKAIEASMSDIERALVALRDSTTARVMTTASITEYLNDCGVRPPPGRALSIAYAAAGMVPCDRTVMHRGRRHRVVALRDGDTLKTASTTLLASELADSTRDDA